MSKDKKDDVTQPDKPKDHGWRKKTIKVTKPYLCEICKKTIAVGVSAKIRVDENSLVFYAHADCVEKGKNLTSMSEKEHTAAVLDVRDETCAHCPKKDKCETDCEILEEAIATVGTVQ